MAKRRSKSLARLRSQGLGCLPRSIGTSECLAPVLSFLAVHDIGELCFEAAGVRADSEDSEAAWRALCAAAVRDFKVFTIASEHRMDPAFPGGYAALFRERLSPKHAGFWQLRFQAQAEPASTTGYCMCGQGIGEHDGLLYNLEKPWSEGRELLGYESDAEFDEEHRDVDTIKVVRHLTEDEELREMNDELATLCALQAAQQDEALARIAELLEDGARAPAGFLTSGGCSDEVARLLLATGDVFLGTVCSEKRTNMDLTPRESPGPAVRFPLDELDSGGSPLALAIRSRGGLKASEAHTVVSMANDASERAGRAKVAALEARLLTKVEQLEDRFKVVRDGDRTRPLSKAQQRVLARERSKIRDASDRDLGKLDRCLLRKCAEQTGLYFANSRRLRRYPQQPNNGQGVFELLMAGANPDFFEGKYYWPNPLTEAVSAMNPETVRLLVAAGADVNTMEMVPVGIGSYESMSLIDYALELEPSWILDQESDFMTELLAAFGFRAGRDIESSVEWQDPFGENGTDYSVFWSEDVPDGGPCDDETYGLFRWDLAHRGGTAAEPADQCAIM